MKLIVGLGNPGKEYENTRHNVGFKVIDSLLEKYNLSLNKNRYNAEYYLGNIDNERVLIIKPMTYMNLSGEAIIQFINYYKINLEDIIVVFDDMDLNVGDIRIRAKGSSGGQNGMKNIINHLHSEEIARIRVGIGKSNIPNIKDYVLSNFNKDEQVIINESIIKARDAIITFVNYDINKTMNEFNKQNT